ncbi:MAG TPA: hypothetical protein VMG38_00590 [Trebonia sp.]|nr:hypothetical protein [Trebonia sp.]
MSDEIALRPVREDDLPVLDELTQDPDKTGPYRSGAVGSACRAG